MFASFAEVAPDVIKAFTAEHPELSEYVKAELAEAVLTDGPPDDPEKRIWDSFRDDVDDKFGGSTKPPPRTDPYPDDEEP
jgi:hypothetical protein